MHTKGITPKEFVLGLLKRSDCAVQVAACLSDKTGIHAWGWNSMGPDGFGQHAEEACFKRANNKRIGESILWVIARRKKSKGLVKAKPCAFCAPLAERCAYTVYRDKTGEWVVDK